MTSPNLADRIRQFVFDNYVKPGLEEGKAVDVRAGDVHAAMKFKDRIPAVCAALRSQKFEDEFGLRQMLVTGPTTSSTTTFVFSRAEAESARTPPPLLNAHLQALEWFGAKAGQIVPWSHINSGDPIKASQAKGIYRPEGWRNALSIKVMPGGPYPDELPSQYAPGLVFRYHREVVKDRDPARERSNLGLLNCMRDRVPVGVIRQAKPKPNAMYEVIGLGQVIDYRAGFFSIQLVDSYRAYDINNAGVEGFPPWSDEDARRRVLRSIVARQGQAKFRQALFEAYDGRCAISECNVSEVLEAAHIRRYLGEHTNIVPNGLLLRADLHTLYDFGLLRIDPQTRKVVLSNELFGTEYGPLNGLAVRQPMRPCDAPAMEHLLWAWDRKNTA